MSIQIPYSVDHSMISQSENTFPSPISGACVECRSRHLKCDSGMPVCGRCQYEERQCQYVQSRRGHKGPRKRRISSTIDPIPEDLLAWETNTREINNISFEQMTNTMAYSIADVSSRSLAIAKSQGPQTSKFISPFDSVPDQESFSTPYEELLLPLSCVIPNEQPSKEQGVFDKPSSNHRTLIRDVEFTERTKSLELYYLHFHRSHPILLPRNILFGASFEQFPSCLKKVMQFIGSHYLSKTLADRQLITVSEEVSAEKSRSGYMVQALLLYAIVLHARDDQSQAEKMVNAAFEMAINLGMHREEFATDHGCGSRYLEESWRKTWWELYVVDSMISLHMQIPFKRSTIDMSALLPNDEITDLDAVVRILYHTSHVHG